MGTAIPGVGNAVGAVIGAVVGGATGAVAGQQIARHIDPKVEDDYWRANHGTQPYASGSSYDEYQPAYRYGYTLATDDRYRGRPWNEIEPEARKAWNNQNQNTWEDFKDAVQYSWDKVRGKY